MRIVTLIYYAYTRDLIQTFFTNIIILILLLIMILIMQYNYTKITVVRVYVRVGGHRKLFDLN